jgi:ABC-type Fe3+-citrate transport system substrate-binding protein
MEGKRDLNFEVNNANELNKMLTGVLMQVRRGELNHDTVKSITLVADKINKNNVNQLEYKKICKHDKEIAFLEQKITTKI